MKDIIPKTEKERVGEKVSGSDFLNRPRKAASKPPSSASGQAFSKAPIREKPREYREPQAIRPLEEDSSRFGIWVIAFFTVIIMLFALSFLFRGAKVVVTPRIVEVALDETLTAFRDGQAGQLSFDTVALSGEETTTVLTSEVKEVTRKASGRVIIYNNYSSNPQRLLIETRLETPDGKIYKTDVPLTVPGQTVENGEKIPGSIEVRVYADQPGEQYNIGMSDFAISGFKGGPRYDKFYARSLTSMTGGKVGELYVLGENEGLQALENLRETLSLKLAQQIGSQLPPNFVLFSDTTIYKTEEKTEFFESEQPEIVLTEKGKLHAFIFNQKQLAQEIARQVVSDFEDAVVIITNLDEIVFTLEDIEQIDPETEDQISFSVAGNVKIVWDIDEVLLKQSLLERRKKEFKKILSQFENIDSAEVVLRPFWTRTFPEKIKDIKVINTANLK